MPLSSSNRIALVGSNERSIATRSTSSRITMEGCSAVARSIDAPTVPRLCPVSSTPVRPRISAIRYIAVSVVPVPGGP
jgi:hypothetical protein